MPFFYPIAPLPANTHMPAILDPSLSFSVDAGYSLRRARHSRARRIVQLDYTNLTTLEVRVLRDFLITHRLSVTPFSWYDPVMIDTATVAATTPITLTLWHTFQTGQWIVIGNAFTPALNNFWPITRISVQSLTLNGSSALGTGTCRVHTYFPYAIGHVLEDRLESPVKLRGPESADTNYARYSMSVQIEEIF